MLVLFYQTLKDYLLIKDLRPTDAGLYRCIATDSNGCVSYREGELKVLNVKRHRSCKFG